MRTALVSYEVTHAWEMWYIDITDDDAPAEITVEWLEENPDKWEYFDLKDRGDGGMAAGTLEVEDFDPIDDDEVEA